MKVEVQKEGGNEVKEEGESEQGEEEKKRR